jgi:ABC-2 type transport system ATP-binding protein
VRRYQPNGSRVRAIVEANAAAAAISWAQALRSDRLVSEFSLTPASLEDVYVDLVSSPPAGRSTEASSLPTEASALPTEEVSHARAA